MGGGSFSLPNVPDVFDVQAYGAVGNGRKNDAGAIQAAINAAAAAGGGTVLFPGQRQSGEGAVYAIAKTLNVGRESTPVSGIILQSTRRALGQSNAVLLWTGSTGGTMLNVRMAHSCAYRNMSFDGAGLANYCVQFHYVAGDSLQCEHHDLTDCYFSNALLYNELIGEPDEDASSGDASLITHYNCYYQQSVSGVHTIAHVRHRSVNALNNVWNNCQFYGDATYPRYAVSMGGGSAQFYGCATTILGLADFYITNDAGVAPGSIICIGQESQGHKLLLTSTDGTYAIRGSTFTGCTHTDIEDGGDPDSVDWDINGAPLTLIGNTFQSDRGSGGNVNALRPTVSMFSLGNYFPPSKGFVGYTERVMGNYRDGSGNNQELRTQYETTGWGVQQSTNVSAFVPGSVAAFSTTTPGEYFYLTLNGTAQRKITLAGNDTSTTVIANINNVFGSSGVNGYPANGNASGQLTLRASNSIVITEGSSGTLLKLGLTAGTYTSPGEQPIATLESTYSSLPTKGTRVIGDDELAGILTVAANTGTEIGTASCIFQLTGTAHSTIIESTNPNGYFGVTKDGHGTINVYWDWSSLQYTIQNNRENNIVLSCQFLGLASNKDLRPSPLRHPPTPSSKVSSRSTATRTSYRDARPAHASMTIWVASSSTR
jgi:hypothetical protein